MASALPAVKWRRSPRAKRIKLALCPWRGIELVVPKRASTAQAQAFLDSRREWMEKSWARLKRQVPEAFESAAPEDLILPAIWRAWRLVYGQSDFRDRGDELHVPGEPTAANAAGQLKPWLMAQARSQLPVWTRRVAARSGLTDFKRVQVRDQRTRWGSCSARGTISLNFRLLFHRPAVVDYLILHELCHTRHMNHGPKFQALLSRHEPDWRALDAELSHGSGGVPGWVGW
ncbi:SprT family zinc-dependent metalloprotease [Gammaproteobacteria bacterium AB-CW1]|uniref:SprT family zinc-dependent metalloprotease n=1 Tax=Natronospira elongata TaxID=3110268 RepID=A0AAP6MM70_9GAMM|nr:SprT family zinc-dependent metalloprotease [Gammaproteobacteria bacterium AB-CW1]